MTKKDKIKTLMPLITNSRVSTSVIFSRIILANIKNQTKTKVVKKPKKSLDKKKSIT
jgi:hypothetical protein